MLHMAQIVVGLLLDQIEECVLEGGVRRPRPEVSDQLLNALGHGGAHQHHLSGLQFLQFLVFGFTETCWVLEVIEPKHLAYNIIKLVALAPVQEGVELVDYQSIKSSESDKLLATQSC